MSRRKPTEEDTEYVALTCKTCALAMLTVGALHTTWVTSDEEAERAKAMETLLEVLADHLGDGDMVRDVVASVRRVYEFEDACEGTSEERYMGPATGILLDAMTACILNAFDEALGGIEGERE